MNRLLAILIFFVMASSGAGAQTILVRSGEHDTFTRLVMHLPSNADWFLQKSRKTAKLHIAVPDIEFDYRQVFGRIPRTRLVGMSQPKNGEALVLHLGCDCNVVGFVEAGGLLVVDIKDTRSGPLSLYAGKQPVNQHAYRFSFSRDPGSKKVDPQVSLPVVRNFDSIIRHAVSDTPRPELDRQNRARRLRINESEQRLLAQISRAADQGLVSLTSRADLDLPEDRVTDRETEAPTPEPHLPSIGVSTETILDKHLSQTAGGAVKNTAPGCLASDMLSIGDWVVEKDFSQATSEIRSELFGEFDRLDQDALTALIKTYLHFGFGAEALVVMQLRPSDQPDHSVYHALGKIIDGSVVQAPNPFSHQQGCKGNVSLWAVLSEPGLAYDANAEAVLNAFVRLPQHLRTHIGPRLSEIFVESGQTSLASSILRATDRSGHLADPAQELASAQVTKSLGDPETAAAQMANVVDSGSDLSPRALVELIETSREENLPIQTDIPELAGAYLAEFRHTELGPELRRANVVSLALVEKFDDSFSAMSAVKEQDDAGAYQDVLEAVFPLLAENADDVTFLKYSLWQIDKLQTDLTELTEENLARRLMDLGFFEPALSILATSPGRPASAERRLMRAEASLALNHPHRTLIELLGVPGPIADHLRARAMWQNRNFMNAGQMLVDANRDDEAARSFWFADSWDAPLPDDRTKYSRLADLSSQLKQQTIGIDEHSPLANAKTLLQSSETARTGINELLSEVVID